VSPPRHFLTNLRLPFYVTSLLVFNWGRWLWLQNSSSSSSRSGPPG